MAIRRKRLEYDVYPREYEPGQGFFMDLRTFRQAKRRARGLGPGAQVWRSVQATNKKLPPGDWWDVRLFLWTGREFKKVPRGEWNKYAHIDPASQSRRG